MPTYLVTGGCGFIGSHLVDSLLAAGHQVRVIDDLSTGALTNLPAEREGLEVMQGCIANFELMRSAMKGCDGVFHLAAVASVQRANEDWLGTHVTYASNPRAASPGRLACAQRLRLSSHM